MSGTFFTELVESFAPIEEVIEHVRLWQKQTNVLQPLKTVHDCMPKCKGDMESYISELLPKLYQELVQDYPHSFDAFVKLASEYGSIPSLEILYQYAKEHYIDFPIQQNSVDSSNNIPFLEWWKDKLPQNYQLVIKRAEIFENENVIKWWLQSGVQMIIDEEFVFDLDYGLEPTMIRLLHNTQMKIPKDMLKSTLLLITEGDSIIFREKRYDDLKEILDWMFQKYEEVLIEILLEESDSDYGHTFIVDACESTYFLLRYLHAKGIPFNYTEELVDNLKSMDQVEFWETSGLPIKHTCKGFFNCLMHDVRIGQWWLDNGMQYKKSYCIDTLINTCRTESIQFLLDNGIAIRYTEKGINNIKIRGDVSEASIVSMMQWLLDNGHELKYTEVFITKCLLAFAYRVLDFCFEHANNKFPVEMDFTDLIWGTRIRTHQDQYYMMLQWWLRHDLKLIISNNFIDCVKIKMPRTQNLLEEYGYVLERAAEEV